MIDQVIMAMAAKIHELFPDVNIYTETVEQGLEEPAFYIHCINVNHQDQIAGRFIHSMPFEVVYFTDKGAVDQYTKLQTLLVSMRLIMLKKVIEHEVAEGEKPIPDTVITNKIRGTELNGRIIDGELHFFVNYDLILALDDGPGELMQNLELNERIK